MGKGKRADTKSLAERCRGVWEYIKSRKKIFIPAVGGVAAAGILAAVLIALAGGKAPPPEEPEPSPFPSPVLQSPSPSPSPSPEEPSPELVYAANPLTGLPILDEELIPCRPVAVMHNNSYDKKTGRHHALPMYGISRADIIYEVLAEGGITRMLAFYQDVSGIPKIGAVRSTRTYYLELALAYDAVLVHAGGSPQAIDKDIPNWKMDTINSMKLPASDFWRDTGDRPNAASEHTLFTSGEKLLELLGGKITRRMVEDGFDNGLHYDNDREAAGGAAGTVKVPFTTTKPTWFRYNADDGLYYVEEYGEPYIDGQDESQIAVANVLVVKTKIGIIPDDYAGRMSVDLQSGGKGYYISGGKFAPITWSREAHDAPFRYTDVNGEPLEMRPGKMYVCVIGNEMEPEFE